MKEIIFFTVTFASFSASAAGYTKPIHAIICCVLWFSYVVIASGRPAKEEQQERRRARARENARRKEAEQRENELLRAEMRKQMSQRRLQEL